jgi:hypothetical protein
LHMPMNQQSPSIEKDSVSVYLDAWVNYYLGSGVQLLMSYTLFKPAYKLS